MKQRVVVDETGVRMFMQPDLEAANTLCEKLIAEGRKAFVAGREPYDLVGEAFAEINSRLAVLTQQLRACELAALGELSGVIRPDPRWSPALAAVCAVRADLEAATAGLAAARETEAGLTPAPPLSPAQAWPFPEPNEQTAADGEPPAES